MNKAILHGNAGKDPVIRTTTGGKKTASFSLATSKFGKDNEGNRTTTTTWHNIILWEKLAEIAEKHVKKGSSLIIEGEIQYRTYEDKDGVTKNITEIVGREMHFAGGKKDENKTGLDAAKETAEYRQNLAEMNGIDQNEDLPY